MLNKIKKHWLLVLILILGIGVRFYNFDAWYNFNHDQDLAGWVAKDVLVDKHIRLIGQETSSSGVFIGPLFYYLLLPFYIIGNWNPVFTTFLPIILSGLTIYSFYFVFTKIFDKKVGIFAALIYALSFILVFTDREPVPTMPVMLWAIWFLYALWAILKGKQKVYILVGLLFGLVWHLNLSLAILAPLVGLAQILSKKKMNFKYILIGGGIFVVLMLPFFAFEYRHNFIQAKAIKDSLTTQKEYIPGTAKGWAKFDRVMQLVHTNTTTLFWKNVDINSKVAFYGLVFCFIYLVISLKKDRQILLFFVLWQIMYLLFFSLNSKNVSEYYLQGMNVIWIGIASITLSKLVKSKNNWPIVGLIIILFSYINLKNILSYAYSQAGYKERKTLVEFIKSDAQTRNYDCVSISYISDYGNERGYRYLYWWKGLKIKKIGTQVPVYTIVFPHSKVDRLDKTFGALGLVFPDYQKYNVETVNQTCLGEDENMIEPMIGFPK